MTATTICIIQPFDPRGRKIGGIESHIRDMIRSAPADVDILLIGIDEVGDLVLNKPQAVTYDGRSFTLLPLLARTGDEHLHAARSLKHSLTLQFFLAFLRRLPLIRRSLRGLRASAEIQRFEYATFGKLLGIPTVQLVHGEGARDQPMDSLLKRYWFTRALNERVTMHAATRVIGVNPRIVDRIGELYPFAAGKTQMLTVSVNTDVFALAPAFPPVEPFRICFAGRLDAFKRPDLMFRIVAALAEQGERAIEFHYIGSNDPEAFPDFAPIRGMTVLHGTQTAQQVAATLASMHCGILVSEFEGMPVYVLELLAVGRPLVALELPQLALIVEEGVSGTAVPRGATDAENVSRMAQAYRATRAAIAAGLYEPAAIRRKIEPFSHSEQKAKLLDIHRAIAVPLRA